VKIENLQYWQIVTSGGPGGFGVREGSTVGIRPIPPSSRARRQSFQARRPKRITKE
jgi:hypothetical protein